MTVDPIIAALVILSVLTALLFAGGAGLYRRIRELELAVHTGVGLGVPIGDGPLPALGVPGRTTIVVKVDRRCPVCEEVLDAVGRLAPALPRDAGFTVLADGPGVAAGLPEDVRVVRDPDVWRSVTVPYVPALLVVDGRGTVVHTAPAVRRGPSRRRSSGSRPGTRKPGTRRPGTGPGRCGGERA